MESPDIEDLFDDNGVPLYEPSEPGEAHASDADDEAMESPMCRVLSCFTSVLWLPRVPRVRSARPAPRRQVSVDAPAPESPKRLRTGAVTAASSSFLFPGAATASHVPTEPDHTNVPVPEDDEDLYLDDVFVTDDAGDSKLPTGWVVIDGGLAMDEAWLARATSEKRMNIEEREKMIVAKKAELTSYFDNAVWEFTSLLPGEHDRVVTARWVLNWKASNDGGPPKAKARLVLGGFQDPGVFDLEKASPTTTKQSKFVILSLAPIMQWTIFCGDVKTAFLSGANFDRKIVVKLPADCGPLLGCTDQGPTYMRMPKSAYGLADAPLLWHRQPAWMLGVSCRRPGGGRKAPQGICSCP